MGIEIVSQSFLSDDAGLAIEWYVTVRDAMGEHTLTFAQAPTHDDIIAALPDPPVLIEPGITASVDQLRDDLDSAVVMWAAWEQFASKAESLGHPAATALRGEANRLGQRVLRVADEWRSRVS